MDKQTARVAFSLKLYSIYCGVEVDKQDYLELVSFYSLNLNQTF